MCDSNDRFRAVAVLHSVVNNLMQIETVLLLSLLLKFTCSFGVLNRLC